MIRFGVVLSVVLVAIGLLAAGVAAGSLLLVFASIGVAALAFLLLVVVVVMSRHELFGQPAGQAGGLTAFEPTASVAAAASPGKARTTAGSGPAAALESRAPAVPAGIAARSAVAAQPEVRRTDTEISKGRKGRGGAGARERVAQSGPAGGREAQTSCEAETSREAEPSRETTAAKAGAESTAGKVAGQPVADRPATTAPDRAAAAAKHDADAPVRRSSGAPQAAKEAPAEGGAVAAGSPAAASPAAASPAATSPAATARAKDKRGEQFTPAVQLIDAAAAKAKAGAEEVMQEAAAERSSVARSDQTAGGRPAAAASVRDQDRQKEYRASKLERESARAASASAAAEPAGDAESSAAAEAPQVSVVPGITRYHRGDCLLIRFLSPDDLELMTRQGAIDSGCAPCKACKPDDETPDLRAG